MEALTALFGNRVLLAAFLGWFVAQTVKVIISIIKTKKFDFERISGAGGMPSSHSCMVTALTIATAIQDTVNSTTFALALVFAFVTLYDAMGVRWQAGLHARLLNKYTRELQELKEQDASENRDTEEEEEEPRDLKEYIGHKPLEVLVGVLLGILIAMVVCFVIPK